MSREHALITNQTLDADLDVRKKALAELEVAGAKVFGGDKAKVCRIDESACRVLMGVHVGRVLGRDKARVGTV